MTVVSRQLSSLCTCRNDSQLQPWRARALQFEDLVHAIRILRDRGVIYCILYLGIHQQCYMHHRSKLMIICLIS